MGRATFQSLNSTATCPQTSGSLCGRVMPNHPQRKWDGIGAATSRRAREKGPTFLGAAGGISEQPGRWEGPELLGAGGGGWGWPSHLRPRPRGLRLTL